MRKLYWLILLYACLGDAAENKKVEEYFHFDQPDVTVAAQLLESPNFYDASIAPAKSGFWFAWLEFIPAKGDLLWVGLRSGDKWISKKQISETPGDYANPTLTFDAHGTLWLTFEKGEKEDWHLFASYQLLNGNFSTPKRFTSTAGVEINHSATPEPDGGIFVVWQKGTAVANPWGGSEKFLTKAGHVKTNGFEFEPDASGLLLSSWNPSATVTPDKTFHIICDAYDGTSYNVYHWASAKNSGFDSVVATPAFEAHAQIASGKNGKIYVAWEEDGETWGKRYTAQTSGLGRSSRTMTDKTGPLHRFRKLHFAELENGALKKIELPQPSFALANKRTDAPADLKNFGAFYEHAQVVVDGQNRPWIVFRHFYVPWIGLVPETHKQNNMRIYARCLLPDGWSKLYAFDEGQGDGMQRIFAAPTENGIAITWTTGRTDRRKTPEKRGVAFAEIRLENSKATAPAKIQTFAVEKNSAMRPMTRQRPSTEVAGKKYELFFGDMHRHTDISLCFSPVDGTIDDAYRYAIDVAPLDFLGITDHTHDLDMGEPLAQIWHRSRKEVNRHQLANRFIPLYSYERSRGDTDHNVFSLRDDMLRPHTYPLSQFWKELDTNTFTVAHQPFNPVTWTYKDDVHRPLLEIYQGFRNESKEEDAKQALARGNHVGFIAASDHLSTMASFACVWVEKPERESLFRALQARRTFAATAQIQLKVTCGEHWMGEQFSVREMPPINVEIKGTGEIQKLDFFVDGELKSSVVDLIQTPDHQLKWEIPTDKTLSGSHNFWIRVTQTDGNRAWSSPLWVKISK